MWKPALLVLAASLLFPLMATWASPPDADHPAPPAQDDKLILTQRLLAQLQSASGEEAEPEEGWVELRALRLEPTWTGFYCFATSDDPRCADAAELVGLSPCLTTSDCPAARAWEEAMGQMGVRPAPRAVIPAFILPSFEIEQPELEQD